MLFSFISLSIILSHLFQFPKNWELEGVCICISFVKLIVLNMEDLAIPSITLLSLLFGPLHMISINFFSLFGC